MTPTTLAGSHLDWQIAFRNTSEGWIFEATQAENPEVLTDDLPHPSIDVAYTVARALIQIHGTQHKLRDWIEDLREETRITQMEYEEIITLMAEMTNFAAPSPHGQTRP